MAPGAAFQTMIHYAIITNPASGRMTKDKKRATLAGPAQILEAEIHGMDTRTPGDFALCARRWAGRCDTLVVAGGDGTFSDVINAVDTSQTTVAYIPLGSGNSLGHALGYKGDPSAVARRIKRGRIRQFDLINCDNIRRGFMASVGIEGTVLRDYDRSAQKGYRAYLWAALKVFLSGRYRRPQARVVVDDIRFETVRLLTLMVVKQPYYGFGMKVLPQARFDDGRLHTLCITSGLPGCAFGVMSAFTVGNRIGRYCPGIEVSVELDRPIALQIDGNPAWKAREYSFTVMPGALKIVC